MRFSLLRGLPGRWRALRLADRIAFGALVALLVAVAIGVAGPNQLRFPWLLHRTTPESTLAASLGPISTGTLVQPSAPGQTPFVGADNVPFQRPSYPYVGSAPWQIQQTPDITHELEGYASRPSYLPGQTLRLAVSTTAPQVSVTIWRVAGDQPKSPFRLMSDAGSFAGRQQTAATVDPATRMVSVHWGNTFAYRIPDAWPSGVYLARLASSENVQAYVPFVVRSPAPHTILVVSSALNWQAYNEWGGSSVYRSRVGEPLPGVTRAFAVSFDRPYLQDGGAGQLFFLELPFLAWIDRQGLDVSYTTDYDLSVAPDAQPLPKVVVFNGHSEYWGPLLYGWLDRHVNIVGDLGLATLAADTGYWPIQFRDETPNGPRSFVCLKNGPVPPALVPPGSTVPPASPTAPGSPAPPGSPNAASSSSNASPDVESPSADASPESSPDIEERSTSIGGYTSIGPTGPYLGNYLDQPLLGVRYQGITSALGRYTLGTDGADPRLLAGTDLAPGSSLGFIAGGEVDGVDASPDASGALGGRYDHVFAEAAAIPGNGGRRWTAQAVWRDLPSGGRVFSSGTFYWGWALDPTWGPVHQVPASFGRLTLNILRFLAGG